MGIPQIIYIVYGCLSITVACFRHGKTQVQKYNLGFATFSAIIMFGLVIWGGFFNEGMHTPQIIFCITMGIAYIGFIFMDGKSSVVKSNVISTIIAEAIRFLILFNGGFFS